MYMAWCTHNPPEYNDKVYWDEFGCQTTAPKDTQIINEVMLLPILMMLRLLDEEECCIRYQSNIIGYMVMMHLLQH